LVRSTGFRLIRIKTNSFVKTIATPMTKSQEVIASFAKKLIEDGNSLLQTQFEAKTSSFTTDKFVDVQKYHQWCASCRLLVQQLGPFAEPYKEVLTDQKRSNNTTKVLSMLGALESVVESVEHGRLAAFEDIVFAEAFTNLIEQGEYLIEMDYRLAAAVIFRAVLEERLRRLCDVHNVLPEKPRPTIADYNQSLYKGLVYDKIVMKHVDAMAAVGNAAAHGTDDFNAADVTQLHANLIPFLARFSIK
jgi:hypothetical protein